MFKYGVKVDVVTSRLWRRVLEQLRCSATNRDATLPAGSSLPVKGKQKKHLLCCFAALVAARRANARKKSEANFC